MDNDELEYYEKMEKLFVQYKDSIVAVGECGLDYDRLHYADKKTQLRAFPIHFEWAQKFDLPMYLHSRNCKDDFVNIMKQNIKKIKGGVVHSYTGCEEELKELLAMGLYIGVNGVSVREEKNIEVLKKIPIDRIMLESMFIS